jgi:tetraacyldisaccharide 4'-kinase
VVAERSFADHHPFSASEIAALLAEAQRRDLLAVTTEKDLVRLGATAHANAIVPFAVTLQFDDRAGVRRFITDRLGRSRAKKFRSD